ncbi:MAG: hypothetical protein AAFP79_03320 [Pseudomonadota bacterium]
MMVKHWIGTLALALATPAIAQVDPSPQPAEPDGDIIVEAPPSKAERKRELRRMISGLFRNPRSGRTVATFLDAPCPEVFGIPDAIGAAIASRIRANAADLGVNRRDPRENCKRNISIIFVGPEKGQAIDWLTDDSDLLDHLLLYERTRVLNEEGPVRAWTYKNVLSADGFDIPDRNGRSAASLANFANRVIFPTRLSKPISVELSGAVVMIERQKAEGKTLEQLADYATMRAFADLNGLGSEHAYAAPTILTLFENEGAPGELTDFDRAFLSKLYRAPRNSRTNRFYSVIAANAERSEREASLSVLQD